MLQIEFKNKAGKVRRIVRCHICDNADDKEWTIELLKKFPHINHENHKIINKEVDPELIKFCINNGHKLNFSLKNMMNYERASASDIFAMIVSVSDEYLSIKSRADL